MRNLTGTPGPCPHTGQTLLPACRSIAVSRAPSLIAPPRVPSPSPAVPHPPLPLVPVSSLIRAGLSDAQTPLTPRGSARIASRVSHRPRTLDTRHHAPVDVSAPSVSL